MTQAVNVMSLSVTATGAIARGRGVTFAGAQIAAAGAKPLGIAQVAAAAAGPVIPLSVMGTAIAEAGAAIALGAALAMDASGRVITATALGVATGATAVTSAAANGASAISGGEPPQFVVGDALQAAAAAGQLIEILLRR
jgi:hypothetical protein